jgi:hypothetical protein
MVRIDTIKVLLPVRHELIFMKYCLWNVEDTWKRLVNFPLIFSYQSVYDKWNGKYFCSQKQKIAIVVPCKSAKKIKQQTG